VHVRAPAGLVQQVRALCNGRCRWGDVEHALAQTWGAATAAEFLRDLAHGGVLIEAGSQLGEMARVGWVPQVHRAPLTTADQLASHRAALDRRLTRATPQQRHLSTATALSSLLVRRGSASTFGEPTLPWQSLVNVLWALYGVTGATDTGFRRTVPSGGALYAIDWILALLVDCEPYRAGWYRVAHHARGDRPGEVSVVRVPGKVSDAWRTLLTPAVLSHAQSVLYPVVDLAAIERKYGNRALTLAMVEAGHALQNAALAAMLEGGASIVRGDTIETEVQRVLRLPRSAYPLPALVLGRKPESEQVLAAQRADLRVPLKNQPKSGRSMELTTHQCVAGPLELSERPKYECWSGGRATDARLAAIKAEAEGWERIGWATPRVAELARLRDVPDAVDPRRLVSYAKAQYRQPGLPYERWTDLKAYPWARGMHAGTGQSVSLMAQCVYALSSLEPRHRRHVFTNATTSGVAAWGDAQGAVARAVVELVERDAFARAWLLQASPRRLRQEQMPAEVQARMAGLEQAGYRMSAHLLPSKYLPVVCVFAQCAPRCLTSVTTAASFSVEQALSAALSETESRVQAYHDQPVHEGIERLSVQRETDHATYYRAAATFRAADVLAANRDALERADWKAVDRSARGGFESLLSRLRADGKELYAIDLAPPGASLMQGRTPLQVWRAFVPGLLPLWFGTEAEPLGLVESGVVDLGLSPRERQQVVQRSRPVHPCT
jgi:ribosomal protein S12 methylthiotransferase accessory factor